MTVHTCEPADPASEGGSESTAGLGKADLVPKDTNLLGGYAWLAALEAACGVFCGQVGGRVHRVTRRVPAQMLAEEQARLHPVPAVPHTVAFGVTRTVAAKTPMVAFGGGQYPVPWALPGQPVWVRAHGTGEDEQVIVVHVGESGPAEVARHARAAPGSPQPTMSISRPPRPARSGGHREPAPPLRLSSSPWVTGRGCGWPRLPRPAPGGCNPVGQTAADGPMVDTSCACKMAADLPARPAPAVVSKVSRWNAQCPLWIPPKGRSEPLAWNLGLRYVPRRTELSVSVAASPVSRRSVEFSGHARITARAAAVASEAVAMPG